VSTLDQFPESRHKRPADNWTPARGLFKGTVRCVITAGVLAAVMCLGTALSPSLTTLPAIDSIVYTIVIGAFHVMIAFIITAILFGVMHRASGVVGPTATLLVGLLTVAVVASKHLVLVTHEFEFGPESIQGWAWVHPQSILVTNIGAWLGLAIGIAMFRGGDTLWDYLGLR